MKTNLILIAIVAIFTSSCKNEKKNENTVLEVTTFSLKTTANKINFYTLDAKVEDDFTSKQPGFIRRESGVNEKGEFTVIVYWKTIANADASMKKFMSDSSVSEYVGMIDSNTMKMNRYSIQADLATENSDFIEMMSFNLNESVDVNTFDKVNNIVASKTATQNGFVQRITGTDESGRHVVIIYWDNKKNSDLYLQPFMNDNTSKEFMGMMNQNSISMTRSQKLRVLKNTEISNKDKVVALLNSFNTGDKTPISYINPEKYIQHNLGVADGLVGFGDIMKNAPEGGFKANVIRAFEDGDFVFTHTEYDFFGPKAGFDVFRFEEGKIVEHWDNLSVIQNVNPSGHTQFDGAITLTDFDKSEKNKKTVKDLLENVFIKGEMDKIATYINPTNYVQHNPSVPDGLDGLGLAMNSMAEKGIFMKYNKIYKILGQGNFVLAMSEGTFGNEHTAYYDLFRLENGQIVEHWDVIAPIPQQSEWKNDNGKF